MLVSEAKPILGELVRRASMGQEFRISTGGFVAGAEARNTGKEMVAHMTGRRPGQFRTDDVMKAVLG